MISIERVAALAGIEIRRACELGAVLVGVAIGAALKFDLE